MEKKFLSLEKVRLSSILEKKETERESEAGGDCFRLDLVKIPSKSREEEHSFQGAYSPRRQS